MIDVIVPVYSGYEETSQCIKSLLECKNKIKHRFVIINDKTPDENIEKKLSEIHESNFLILKNDENLGFVKTVNKGMKLSNNDVILLNSDTIVTDYWIDKMYNAAYSSEKVGTVTALTNNGTIASVPYFNQDNVLPAGFTIETFSQLIENVSNKEFPEIPTAVGHAMYIKRKILTEIGYFDEESFGMGYGEEEDFSCRVIKKGYKNIIADDTYIYHYGSTSFKSEKEHLIKENKKKLRKKHWKHPFNVKKFLYVDNEVKQICRNIQFHLNK